MLIAIKILACTKIFLRAFSSKPPFYGLGVPQYSQKLPVFSPPHAEHFQEVDAVATGNKVNAVAYAPDLAAKAATEVTVTA